MMYDYSPDERSKLKLFDGPNEQHHAQSRLPAGHVPAVNSPCLPSGWALACITSRAFRTKGPQHPASCLPLIGEWGR